MKKLRLFDYIIIFAVIAIFIVSVLVCLGKHKFSKSPVEAIQKVAFQVMLRSVSITDSQMPFKVGDESFITIRNVPYTKLRIIDVAFQPKKTIVPVNSIKEPFVVVDDYSLPYQYDFVVSLIDDAKITKDGAVVGGNKLKIGMPIVLEGFNYRIGGTVSNVQIIDDEKLPEIEKLIREQIDKQNIANEQVSKSVK